MICKIYTLRTSEESGCIIIENEAGEMIASSGCEEGIPTLCTQFCQAWINNPLIEVEIWEGDVIDISNAYTEEFGYLFTPQIGNEEERFHSEGDVFQESYQDYLDNQLPEIPNEIHLETDQPFITSETEAIEVEEFYNENPTGGEHVNKVYPQFINCTFVNCDMPEAEQFSQEVDKLTDAQIDLERMEQEARQELQEREKFYDYIVEIETPAAMEREFRKINNLSNKKHVLIKRANLPKRVNWEMLVNSSHLIWNAGHLLGLGQDPNNIVIVEGQEAVKNLELFLSLMPNPKFATVSSFQIEKHGKN